MLPSDFGFSLTRGGTRWREWRGHGHRVGYELVDEQRGEWAVYAGRGDAGPSLETDDAWSEGEARRRASTFARGISEQGGAMNDDFDFSRY
jgi:hypothetical protein